MTPLMKPDYDAAALKAAETLIKYRINSLPIEPIHIIKATKGVILMSFRELAEINGVDRKSIMTVIGDDNKEAIATVRYEGGKLKYVIAYNQRLPIVLVQRALARELGHIMLGHDGSRPEAVRTEEALVFARHLLCPRPVLRAIESAGIPLTTELISSLTGCRQRCMQGICATPGAYVPPEINRLVRDQFSDFLEDFIDYGNAVKHRDCSPIANFGTYFDRYEE